MTKTEKKCNTCKHWMSIERFYASEYGDGYRSRCIDCCLRGDKRRRKTPPSALSKEAHAERICSRASMPLFELLYLSQSAKDRKWGGFLNDYAIDNYGDRCVEYTKKRYRKIIKNLPEYRSRLTLILGGIVSV